MAKDNPLSRLWGAWGFLSSVYTWIAGAVGVAAVTAFWANVSQGLHWALFLGSGVLFFGVLTAIFLREYIRTQNAADKLILSSVEVSQRGAAGLEAAWYRPAITFRNLAPYEIYFEVTEFECVFGTAASKMDKTERLNGILPANDSGALSFPALVARPEEVTAGRLMVTVKYGRRRDTLSEKLETTVRVSCLPTAALDFIGPLETLRNTLRLEQS